MRRTIGSTLLKRFFTRDTFSSQHSPPSPTETHHVHTAVIGAGVIGLACARALAMSHPEHDLILLERSSVIGSGTSSRNSEVIHAGIYYPRDSLKAKLCVRGRNLMYEYCQERDVACKKLGKLIVDTHKNPAHSSSSSLKLESSASLEALQQKAHQNGVTNVQFLSPADVQHLEPALSCGPGGGLWSPSTGIVDSHGFMVSLWKEAEEHGAMVSFHSKVVHARILNHDHPVALSVQSGPETFVELHCRQVINCAGLHADTIYQMLLPPPPQQQQQPQEGSNLSCGRCHYFAKGSYFSLQGCPAPFQHLVYPAPEVGGLGVHATLDMNGQCRFGPDVEWLPAIINDGTVPMQQQEQDPDEIDLDVNPVRAAAFYDKIRSYWPGLPDGALVPDYAGIRPKLWHPQVSKNKEMDFVVEGPDRHGIKGVVHLLGMESPGLTASLAIADHVVELLKQR